MPPKTEKKAKKEKKVLSEEDEKMKLVMKGLQKFDTEDFLEKSAANVVVSDSLVPEIFDWLPGDLDKEAEYVLGIDEAGRGPVLGPMVYSAAFCKLDRHARVRSEIGANDSKQLKEIERERMLKSIETSKWVAYTGVVLPPGYLSMCMLRRTKYNLNAISHDTAIQMIHRVIDHHKINVKEVYVDTVGKPEAYQAKLLENFPRIHITVESKADATYPIVGAASIVAKVSRDKLVHNWNHLESGIDAELETGSGYPGDPKTKKWLRDNLHSVFGLPSFARMSWQTSQDIIADNALMVTWEDQDEEDEGQTKIKIGSKRAGEDQQKSRKSAFFREYSLHRASLENFMEAY